jgi:hypothetical protein
VLSLKVNAAYLSATALKPAAFKFKKVTSLLDELPFAKNTYLGSSPS